jgi:hypothetical protein
MPISGLIQATDVMKTAKGDRRNKLGSKKK